MKRGTENVSNPMRVHLKLFFKWGIQFDEAHPYTVKENSNRVVAYANKAELIFKIKMKYEPEAFAEPVSESEPCGMADPEQTKTSKKADRKHTSKAHQKEKQKTDNNTGVMLTAPINRSPAEGDNAASESKGKTGGSGAVPERETSAAQYAHRAHSMSQNRGEP